MSKIELTQEYEFKGTDCRVIMMFDPDLDSNCIYFRHEAWVESDTPGVYNWLADTHWSSIQIEEAKPILTLLTKTIKLMNFT